jgi:hypothetical protein
MARDRKPCCIDYRAVDAATNHQAHGGIGWAGRSREKRVFAEDRVPLNMVSKWMGHAKLETTAIYCNAVGEEQQTLAARMWTR